MATASDVSTQSYALTQTFKAQQNSAAARLALLVSVYYSTRVNVEDPSSIEQWLSLMIPRLKLASDDGARRAAAFYQVIHDIEAGAGSLKAVPTLGVIDDGVRKSLLTMGPYDMVNKMTDIRRLDVPAPQKQAMIEDARKVTTAKLASAVVRHAQAGGRQTIIDNTSQDETALGWIRVTRANPCFFCAMLASRGITYRSFKQGSFDLSDPRFIGSGDAKVHDGCGCSLKPVYTENDKALQQNQSFADLWSRWGAGGGDAMLRFRRGYDHFQSTGKYLSWDEANAGLRTA